MYQLWNKQGLVNGIPWNLQLFLCNETDFTSSINWINNNTICNSVNSNWDELKEHFEAFTVFVIEEFNTTQSFWVDYIETLQNINVSFTKSSITNDREDIEICGKYFTNHVPVARRAASILTRYSTALLYSNNKPTVYCICHCCHQVVLCGITCSRLICFFSLSTYPTLNTTPVPPQKSCFQPKRIPHIEQSPSIPIVIMATRLMSTLTMKTMVWLTQSHKAYHIMEILIFSIATPNE